MCFYCQLLVLIGFCSPLAADSKLVFLMVFWFRSPLAADSKPLFLMLVCLRSPLAAGSEPFLVNFRVFIFCSSSLRSPLAAFVEVVAVIAIAYRSHWPLAYVECVLSQSRFRSPLATEGCFHWCRTMDNPLACVFSQCVCALCFSPVKLLEKMYWKTSSRFPTYSIIFAGP